MKNIVTIFLIMLSVHAFSQEKSISGSVIDGTNQPLIGVTIIIKGMAKGAITDFDGQYALKAKPGNVLIFSYLGTETKEVVVGNENIINVTLIKSDTSLDEVVVVGYGTVRKSDLTGSVSSIKAEEITQAGAVSLDQALAGKAAGVVVTQNSGEAGTGASIRVRAISSLNGSEPLYVIDGIPMDNSSSDGLGSEDVESSSLSPLAMINPSDIESVEILKDASSTAIYGSRGANGVILITTKTGKTGKGVVSVEQEYGVSEVPMYIDVLDANNYYILNREASANAGNGNVEAESVRLDSARAGLLQNNDWQKTLFRLGTTSNTNVGFSGGNEDVKYLISTNYLNAQGLVKGTDYKRASTRANINANISEKFKVSTSINYSHVTSTQKAISTKVNNIRGATSAVSRALRASPTSGLLSDDEDEGIELWTPITALAANNYNNLLTQMIGNIDATYNFTKALSFKTAFSYQNRNTAQRYYQLNILPNNVAEGGRARTGDSRNTRTTITNTLNFRKKIGRKNSINAILGQSLESSESEGIYVSNYGFANDLLTYYDPGSATFQDPDRVSYSEDKLASFFGRINYTYNKKYLFTLTGRYDGSSKFAANKKWAFFPAAAFAYKLSEENFMKNSSTINELKLRISYGASGNQAIRTYQSLDQYTSDLTAFNEATSTIYYSSQLPNPNLTWETTTQLDAGIDFGLFKNKLTGTLEYYNKITEDLLFTGNRIPVQSGFGTYTENFGSLETNGLEASFNARIINSENFSWRVKGNIATGKTTVRNMASDYLFSGWDPGTISGGTQRLIIGQEIGTFFGYKTAGIAQFDDFVEFQGLTNQERIDMYNATPDATYTFVDGYEGGQPVTDLDRRPGEQLFEDVTPDGAINADDRTIIGQAQPDITFGISNVFKIGGVDFSIFVDSQIGKDIANIQNIRLLNFSGRQSLNLTQNRWTPTNPSTVWPRVDSGNNSNNTNLFSDRYIEDGSFVRLQNVTIGYNFKKELTEKLNISSLRVYVSGTNLHIWTNYTGFSPDVSLRGSSTTNLGHDNAGYPSARVIRMGVNLKF
ncbi:SusC/RagA family TonB-linked outer membrane protein [Mariniflexile sp. AS56]|uniref:SusC/RagA family TonB-linked outer membrane protein n=1 Tax=Mariniflexile sp. AS56 TaxID=3063957 RepID=UPI0026EEDB79|nr:TonB-dependent receptor [Mariniflexile sp. AS56]MDO7172410.1 TonB-dependent receptor [Mariniflexile sp. AS56]